MQKLLHLDSTVLNDVQGNLDEASSPRMEEAEKKIMKNLDIISKENLKRKILTGKS